MFLSIVKLFCIVVGCCKIIEVDRLVWYDIKRFGILFMSRSLGLIMKLIRYCK